MKETVHIEEPKLARFLFASPAAAPIWLVARRAEAAAYLARHTATPGA